MARTARHKDRVEAEFDEITELVYLKWDNARKTREAVNKKVTQDWNNPDRMAIWRLAAISNNWDIV